jgi:hypothetical protein
MSPDIFRPKMWVKCFSTDDDNSLLFVTNMAPVFDEISGRKCVLSKRQEQLTSNTTSHLFQND